MGILLAQIALFYLASQIPPLVSLFGSFFEIQKKGHQFLFFWIPFSVGDILYIVLILAIGYVLYKSFTSENRQKYSSALLISFNILYFCYQLFWGMLYFQTPLQEKLGKDPIEISQLKSLTLDYLQRCKQSRTHVTENQAGVFIIEDLQKIEYEIIAQQKRLPTTIVSKKSTGINSFKPSIFKQAISYTGILGYYNPFTAEANFNTNLPDTYIPFTLAHESAHQLGFAREQEANFIGYLIGVGSKNKDLKYSTDYFVLKSLLNSLYDTDPDFVNDILGRFSVAMKRDRLTEQSFRKKHEGFLDTIFGFTNDLFLKSNQQEGSITYSYFIDLLVHYEAAQNRHRIK